jgi:hypothetical protein
VTPKQDNNSSVIENELTPLNTNTPMISQIELNPEDMVILIKFTNVKNYIKILEMY